MATTTKTAAPAVSKVQGLRPEIESQLEGARAEVTKNAEHPMPNLGALLIATRKGLGVSQMQLGTNRGTDGKPLSQGAQTPADLAQGSKGRLKSGYFSLIANIEQGGRRTAVPEAFVAYVAKVTGATQAGVRSLVEEDDKVRTAAAQASEAKA